MFSLVGMGLGWWMGTTLFHHTRNAGFAGDSCDRRQGFEPDVAGARGCVAVDAGAAGDSGVIEVDEFNTTRIGGDGISNVF